jgi:uncharacterized membrane protein HdeD (DUF308 family)
MARSQIMAVLWVLVIFLGMIMLFSPEDFVSTLVIGIGVVSIINGLFNVFYLGKMVDDKNFKNIILIRGGASLLAGIAAVVASQEFAKAVWAVIMYLVAGELILSSVLMLLAVGKLKADEKPYKGFYYEVAASFFLALVLLAIPTTVGLILVRIGGGLIVFIGICALVWVIRNRERV